MFTERNHRRILNIQFRVLVIGRANAGKTSILQRVCDTTESPTIYRRRQGEEYVDSEEEKEEEKEEVRGPNFLCESNLTVDQVKLDPSMDVSDNRASLRLPLNMMVPARRAHHRR
jgi:GTPase SAR1 family protein